jgi:predicted TIM-barrel fold metal-dependent hydrolase
MFWFETDAVKRQVDLFPDNIMFETDFPHPTSLSPGPASLSEAPDLVAARFADGMDPELVRKILWGNAARVYQVEAPPRTWTEKWLS